MGSAKLQRRIRCKETLVFAYSSTLSSKECLWPHDTAMIPGRGGVREEWRWMNEGEGHVEVVNSVKDWEVGGDGLRGTDHH